MYFFVAHYLNMFQVEAESVTEKIEIDGQFLNCEKEIYLYAMSQAYDKIPNGYCFDNLEFISC